MPLYKQKHKVPNSPTKTILPNLKGEVEHFFNKKLGQVNGDLLEEGTKSKIGHHSLQIEIYLFHIFMTQKKRNGGHYISI